MRNEQIELLKNAGIEEEFFDKCYITEDNIIFKPIGNITAEELYRDWLENKNNPKPQAPTIQEQINAQLLKENAEQQLLNAQVLKEIADLKGGNA